MKKFNVIATVAALTLAIAFAPTADAQSVNRRLENQHDRIHRGVKSEQLTRRETRIVRSNDRKIRAEERHDRRTDRGHLTRGERVRLQRQLNRNSKRMYRFKHNSRS